LLDSAEAVGCSELSDFEEHSAEYWAKLVVVGCSDDSEAQFVLAEHSAADAGVGVDEDDCDGGAVAFSVASWQTSG